MDDVFCNELYALLPGNDTCMRVYDMMMVQLKGHGMALSGQVSPQSYDDQS